MIQTPTKRTFRAIEPAAAAGDQTQPLQPSESVRRRVAFVVQRCGLEVNGGAELLCRQIATAMSRFWRVEVLTTCALDYMTWANHYPPGEERIGEVVIRRFPVDAPRNVPSFNRLSEKIHPRLKEASIEEQQAWMRAQGPMSSGLLDFLRRHHEDYSLFMFFGYLYAQSYFGLPLVADRSILVPCAHDEWPIRMTMWDHFFAAPRGLLFNTIEEREFTCRRFPNITLPHRVAGIGIELPPSPSAERFRACSGINGPILSYVGRIDPSKGCEEMFQWFLRAKSQQGLPHKLVLVGKATMPIPEHEDIIALGFVEEQVKFDVLCASEWLLMPSRFESLSIAVLEAWIVGTPVLVKSESAVLLAHCSRSNGGIAAEDFNQWERAIQSTLPTARQTLGRNGMAYVSENYTWNRVTAEIKSLADEIRRSGPSKPPHTHRRLEPVFSQKQNAPTMQTMQKDYELTSLFPLRPPLPLPSGLSEERTLEFLQGVCVEGAPVTEMANYCRSDWRRFVYTYGLARDCKGTALEIGGNPYFTTALLLRFTELKVTVTNYFNSTFSPTSTQRVRIPERATGNTEFVTLPFHHFNSEAERFPFADESFDNVLFCEVIEHMQNDPLAVLREINRVLKPGGRLILTTPNVARLENVARLVSGTNIYDPYSGYGPYGRHNREYNMHELYLLLKFTGFDLEVQSTADVHDNHTLDFISQDRLASLVPSLAHRVNDLGQYLFTRSVKKTCPHMLRPAWLYRSYPEAELC